MSLARGSMSPYLHSALQSDGASVSGFNGMVARFPGLGITLGGYLPRTRSETHLRPDQFRRRLGFDRTHARGNVRRRSVFDSPSFCVYGGV
jgi:hypothetical protein